MKFRKEKVMGEKKEATNKGEFPNKIRELKRITLETIEKKEIADKEIRLLKEDLKNAENKLALTEKKLKLTEGKLGKNRCWFSEEIKCPFYSEIRGFTDANAKCGNCNFLDIERFFEISGNIFRDSIILKKKEFEFLEKEKDRAREEGEKEGKEEVYEEITQDIDEFLEGIKHE